MINRQPVDPDVGQGIDSAPAVVLFLPTAKVCEQFVSCAVRLQEQLGKIQIQNNSKYFIVRCNHNN